MSTLKQRFDGLDNQEAFAEDYLAEVKEWLQQKQKEYKKVLLLTDRRNWHVTTKIKLIHELLEDLT